MSVIQKFTLKSLKQNKKRTVVTIIGIIISAAMLTAVSVFVTSLIGMIQRSTIADGGNWHAEIKGLSAQNISVVKNSDIVDTAVISRDLGYSPAQGAGKPYLFVRQYDTDGFARMSIRLVSGRMPKSSEEVLVSKNLSGKDYSVGSELELIIGDIDTANGGLEDNAFLSEEYDENGNVINKPVFSARETRRFTVVGVMEAPGFEKSWSAGYAVLGFIDGNALPPGDNVNVYVTLKNVSRSIYNDVPALADRAGAAGGVEYNSDLLRYYGVIKEDNVYGFLQVFVIIIMVIIMLASISLIYNAFAISVSERSKQLGLLASVGATKRQKRASVYFEGFFLGMIGVPLGIAAGIAGIGITLAAIQPLLDSFLFLSSGVRLALVVPPWSIAATIVLSVITIFVSAWIPARRASKITPIDAIRQTKEVRLSRKTVKTSGLVRRLFGFEAEIALKNLKRSRRKYRATILSLVISLVLFLTVSSYASLTRELSGATYDGYNFDVVVQYSGVNDARRERINESIAGLETAESFTESSKLTGTAALAEGRLSDIAMEYLEQNGGLQAGVFDFGAAVVGLDDKSFSEYTKAAGAVGGYEGSAPKAILINYGQAYIPMEGNNVKKTAGEILNLRPGDTISFTAGDNETKSQPVEITISAVTDARPQGELIGGLSSITLVVPESAFAGITGGFSGSLLKEYESRGILQRSAFISTGDDQRFEEQVKEIKAALTGVNIFNIKSAARAEQNMQLFLGVFVYGFIILISLICIANIFNTVTTNIALRRREFAMLRSVGMTPKGFGRMIRFESIFYGLKGLLYGLPISVAVAYLLFSLEQSVLQSSFTLPWTSYVFGIAMIMVIVLSTMLYSTAKIKKENILDALKEENT